MKRRSPREMARPRARRQVWALGAVAVLGVAVFALVSILPLVSGGRELRQVRRDDVAHRQILDFRATLADWQVFAEPLFSKLGAAPVSVDPVTIARGSALAALESSKLPGLVKTLRAMGFPDLARDVGITGAALAKSISNFGPLLAGGPPARIAAGVAAERLAFADARVVTGDAATALRQASDTDSQQSIGHLASGRKTILLVDAIAAVLVIAVTVLFGQRVRRRERVERARGHRQRFESGLQQALEMSQTEPAAYEIMKEALSTSVPQLQAEMLVADSSHAHFHRALSTPSEEKQASSGCGVVSPGDCPATTRARTLVFASSHALNACPYLKGRESGNLSAACIPISITGQASGVLHAMGRDGLPPDAEDVQYLETTARRGSERIAMLRAFEKSEAQARTDPLTGLWNRRSLENRARELQRDGIDYTLAYGDLDHFKALNDTHGHEAGDQALRLFARVLRESIRPSDVTSRYGGEEFVVILPGCNIEAARKILERLRERLALTLGAGRVPAFTVSFGLASSLDADTFDGLVAVADQALLTAKSTGRNRTVVAGDHSVSVVNGS